MSVEIIIAVLGGSALAALVNQIGEYIRQRKKHQEDTADHDNDKLEAVVCGMRYILLDKTKHLGECYIKDGYIRFDDRRRLNAMHDCYHSGLGGNGDLDNLMKEVNGLPLKLD